MNDVEFYRCLSSPTRLAVLKQLRDAREYCVTDLVGLVGAEQSNLSHQLAELRACGLVEARQDGRRVCYKLTGPRLATILELVERFAEHVACEDPDACVAAGCCA